MKEAIPNLLVIGTGSSALHIGEALRSSGVHVDFLPDLDRCRKGVGTGPPAPCTESRPDLVLFAVDADDTLASADLLQRLLPEATPVVALQPGFRRQEEATQAAPHLRWIRCVVAFDPVPRSLPEGRSGTRHKLYLCDTPQTRQWRPCIERAGFELALCDDMPSVQWGHLLLQLNALFAVVSGLAFEQMLATRNWRIRYARLLDEALGLLAATGIEPRNLLGVPWRMVPMMLRQNDAMLSSLVARHLTGSFEGFAGLSWADEKSLEWAVDATCGEIMHLALGLGLDAPRAVDLAEQLMVIARRKTDDRRQLASGW
ncbi:MAG TPA: hypothetical protein VFY22_14850 [Hydrogenophaga sp.]|nr:hypothetical protein [Hydrogenophaga sp.]